MKSTRDRLVDYASRLSQAGIRDFPPAVVLTAEEMADLWREFSVLAGPRMGTIEKFCGIRLFVDVR